MEAAAQILLEISEILQGWYIDHFQYLSASPNVGERIFRNKRNYVNFEARTRINTTIVSGE